MVDLELAFLAVKSPRDLVNELVKELVEEDIMIEIPGLAKEFMETQ